MSNLRRKLVTVAMVLASLSALSSVAVAATVTLNPTHDATVWNRDTNAAYTDTNFGSSTELEIYRFDNNLNAYSYMQFDLSSIADTITSATLSFSKITNVADPGITGSDRNDTLVDGRIAIYGLLNVAGNTAQNWDESVLTAGNTGDELAGGTTDTETNLFDPPNRSINFDGQETVTSNTVVDLTGTDLLNFLTARVADNGLVTFMLDNPDGTGGRGMAFGSSESTTPPTLTLDVVPEPGSMVLCSLAGLLLAAYRRR